MAQLSVCILALATIAAAQFPGVPHGGGNCTQDWDCSLGGVCQSNVCVCDAWCKKNRGLMRERGLLRGCVSNLAAPCALQSLVLTATF